MTDLSQIPTDQLMKMLQSSPAPQAAPDTGSPSAAASAPSVTDKSSSYVGNVDPDSGDITVGSGAVAPVDKSQGFGFDIPPANKMVMAKLAAEDSKQRQAYMSNRPIAHNILDYLDNLEPNLDKFPTGGYGKGLLASAAQTVAPDSQWAKASGNIDKDTFGLATELGKFQYVPGMRGSVLGLQTILASKPGLGQVQAVNQNIVNDIRGRVTDYLTGQELAQKYRQLSPNQVTDQNTYTLDDALKSIYPLTTTDPKTGEVTFHKENVPLLRQAMDDAIANPQKYLQAAEQGKQIFGKPTQAAQPTAQQSQQAASQLTNSQQTSPQQKQSAPNITRWVRQNGKLVPEGQ
jgi:hypothetical protein